MIRCGRTGEARLAVATPADLDGIRRDAARDLSDEERERWRGLPDLAADELLLGRHLLRTLVRRERGLPAREPVVVLARCGTCGGPHGRPELPPGDLHASIAHAGGLVIAAVLPSSAGCGVGVDVEPLGPTDPAATRAWTRYEAALKADGTGVGANRGETSPAALAALVDALPRQVDVTDVDLTELDPAEPDVTGHAVALAVLRAIAG
ncbi:4'-phosphopantetheinyl transferase family protein [Serinibacter arcticus]|uniref:4'-phosphopantetheinyl transferase family protein n=1 Tax=Serinibacter arcticus TaxID=1655435 RepID=UPI001092F6D0|nr:hypothetical protein [Serinibacter arcticus]